MLYLILTGRIQSPEEKREGGRLRLGIRKAFLPVPGWE